MRGLGFRTSAAEDERIVSPEQPKEEIWMYHPVFLV
jgi:hypothetical protein